MDPEELALVRDTIHHALTTEEPASLIGALSELGFFELAAEDPAGSWSTLFDTQGRNCIASPALDLVVLDGLGLDAGSGAVVYPSFTGRDRPPALHNGRHITIDGLLLSGATRADALVVGVIDDEGKHSLATVRADDPALERHPVRGFDPDLGLVALTGEIELGAVEPIGDHWELATTRARRALAQELTGVSAALLDIALEHVKNREQFGAPIAVFQAVKHRLADVYVAITAARSALDTAWSDDDPFIAMLAKMLAGQAITIAAKHCQQVCGAIGFTWEFGLHRYVRRGLVLDGFLGSSGTLRDEIGAQFLGAGAVPRLGQLSSAPG